MTPLFNTLTAWLSLHESLLIGAYLTVFVMLALYGFHRSQLVYLYYRYRGNRPEPRARLTKLPPVTVQLPLFNEMYVAQRLLEAVASIRYPRELLEIQVLDDSTDETQEICRRKVAELCARGIDAKYIHRTERTGFKAGALANGLRQARGEFILVFDADFLPPPDILEQTIHFFSDPRVGMVQVRWEHINRNYSMLTELQALMLDGHFVIEHTARHRSGRFFNFNGTAGIWRRSAIEDAGGWEHDTLTEDMDLSYRAQLRGWQFVYLPDVVSPAELPVEMNSFKSQQFRWAKGSIQVAKKLLPTILRARGVPFRVKLEAFFHLTNNFAYPLLLLLSVLLLPNLLVRTHHGWREVLLIDLPLFVGTTLSISAFYITSQREIDRRGWPRMLKRLPLMMSLGIGLCINQTRAVLEALLARHSGEFVRTPKHGIRERIETWTQKKYRAARTLIPAAEVLCAVYFAVAMALAARAGHYLSMPFLLLFFIGFAYVGVLSLFQTR
ncbi:MAG: glycosyltransferase family 2 protein [Myxococcales bacterium]|nr:glycosyltransferase family 2 protein [Myxococcota bacterium]MDW8283429.1 glycosyltransferase family 2 protein [Myxococcales bacterium]